MSNFEIHLNSGRQISLQSLNQYLTYEGLLEGLPTIKMNKEIIEGAVKKAVRPHWEGEAHLIQPTERPLDYPKGRKYPFGDPAALPTVICEARFGSSFPARDKSKDLSWLIVVWFQQDFALPIEEEIENQIKAIDWDNIAYDYEW